MTLAEKRAEDTLKKQEKEEWLDLGAMIYQRVIGNSAMLLLAYGLHVLTSG